jgi:hypothetical protein
MNATVERSALQPSWLSGRMLGSMVSSLSQRMVRLGTTALMLSGAGLAGYSYYLKDQAPPQASGAMAWVKDHAAWFIAIGVAGLVLGAVLNMMMARRMQKRMMGSMPGMGSMAGMPGMPGNGSMGAGAGMPAGWPGGEVVKVRCRSCSSLELEGAAYCSKCGKPMA